MVLQRRKKPGSAQLLTHRMNAFSNILAPFLEADPRGGTPGMIRPGLRIFSAGSRKIPVTIRSGESSLPGELHLPSGCTSVVIFAHGSRIDYRGHPILRVADSLAEEGIGTLVVDFWPAGSFRGEKFDKSSYQKRL